MGENERAAGYTEPSIKSWRSTLHLIVADAVEEGLIQANPAARRRNRDKRAGRSRRRGPERAITTVLGTLLIAERAALLSGRDDEFVALVTKAFTGMRFGELVGPETCYVGPNGIRVEGQLYELHNGELHRCPPKDDSYRTIFTPPFVIGLIRAHIGRTNPEPCPCHGQTYVFSGHRPPNCPRQGGATLADVARRAGLSTGLVSMAFNHPEVVSDSSRAGIAAAVNDLGWVRGGSVGTLAPHWRRSGFATWLFQPATTGRYPRKGKLSPRPRSGSRGPMARSPHPGPKRWGGPTPAGFLSPPASRRTESGTYTRL